MGPAALVLALLGTGSFDSATRELGQPAARLALPALDGEPAVPLVRPSTPVVVNFWASWCVPCREEAPLLEAAWRRYRDRVAFVGVDVLDGRAEARRFVAEHGLTYPQRFDEGRRAARAYRVAGVPETFFIDRRGRLVGHYIGAFKDHVLDDAIHELLALRPRATLRLDGSGRSVRVG
jgi:thiol-disulfide isomerase/thioredoxin